MIFSSFCMLFEMYAVVDLVLEKMSSMHLLLWMIFVMAWQSVEGSYFFCWG